jgi:hypothetical protein
MPSAIGRSKRPDSFRQVGRREVDRDALVGRELQPAVLQRRAHPLAGFLDFGVGQADRREAGQAVGQVHLDRDLGGLQGVQRPAADDGKRHDSP